MCWSTWSVCTLLHGCLTACMHVSMHVYMHVCMYLCIYTSIYRVWSACIVLYCILPCGMYPEAKLGLVSNHACACVFLDACSVFVHVCSKVCLYSCEPAVLPYVCMYVCVYVCMYVCVHVMHACMHACAYTHACMHACIYVCMYDLYVWSVRMISMYVCTYVFEHDLLSVRMTWYAPLSCVWCVHIPQRMLVS